MISNICNGLVNLGGPTICISDSMSDEDMEDIYDDNFDNQCDDYFNDNNDYFNCNYFDD